MPEVWGGQIIVPRQPPPAIPPLPPFPDDDLFEAVQNEAQEESAYRPRPVPPAVVPPKSGPTEFVGEWTGFVGRWIALIGFTVCVRYMFFFDQSVDSSGEYLSGRIINMGLANDRIVGMIWGLMQGDCV